MPPKEILVCQTNKILGTEEVTVKYSCYVFSNPILEKENEIRSLTTLAAHAVTESPQKKKDPQIIHRKTTAPVELWYLPWNAS